MQLFDRLVEQWPERTIVPSLAERWEIADDGLRYVFHLREGLTWSDGAPLTAHDVEFGIKRVLNPDAPGSSVAIYFVLENGQDYYLRPQRRRRPRSACRALDDRTVEFRLVAPAPYFMSVMNRPDGGPQPRHAIEAGGDGWTGTGTPGRERRVPGRRSEDDDRLVLERRPNDVAPAVGQRRGGVEYVRSPGRRCHRARTSAASSTSSTVRYTPRLADLVPTVRARRAARAGGVVGLLRVRPRATP